MKSFTKQLVLCLALLLGMGSFLPCVYDNARDREALAYRQGKGSDREYTGVQTIHVAKLPPAARRTLSLIKQGGPFPYAKDGTTFQNREKRLPIRKRGYYREYTVKTPGRKGRGARRIVSGSGGEFYYTADHYRTFRRIKE